MGYKISSDGEEVLPNFIFTQVKEDKQKKNGNGNDARKENLYNYLGQNYILWTIVGNRQILSSVKPIHTYIYIYINLMSHPSVF